MSLEHAAAQEPEDPRPIIWVIGSAFDRRADMLWESKPCRDLDRLMQVVRDAIDRGATEIKIRDFAFMKKQAAERDTEEQVRSEASHFPSPCN